MTRQWWTGVVGILLAVLLLGTVGWGTAGAEYYVSTTGNDTSGDGSSASPWLTIQHAIASAADGDTIHVAAGTYTEVGQIQISKGLTIVGADKDTTIVKANVETSNSGDAKGWWVVSPAVAFNLSGVTLDGNGHKILQGIRHKGTGTIQNVHFTDIRYEQSGPLYAGFAIYAFGMCGAVDVSGCEFDNIGREGIAYWGAGTTGTYASNTYTGKGLGNWLDYGVEVTTAAVVTITDSTITDCRGTATSDGSNSAGIIVLQNSSTATITGNTITGNDIAIKVGYNSTSTSETAYMHNNGIYNNVSGTLRGTSGGAFDATNNWWGSASGPEHAGNTYNVGSQGDKVGDNVDYVPWLDAAAGASFAPVAKNSVATYYASIQAAIGAASDGDKITCAAGTFTEDLVVYVANVEICGAGATTIVQGLKQTAWGLWPLAEPNVDVQAAGVKIHDLTLKNPVWQTGFYSSGTVVGAGNVEIYNVTFNGPTSDDTDDLSQCLQTVDGSGDESGLHVYGCTFTTSGTEALGFEGIYINSGGTGVITIEDNQFQGKVFRAITTIRENVTIHGNTIVTTSDPASAWAGINVQASNVTVTGNSVYGTSGFGVGIDIGASAMTMQGVVINENTLGAGNTTGIRVRGSLTGAGVDAQHNNIAGNVTSGVDASTATGLSVDATNCWWGKADGPGVVGPGTGDKVSANVTYSPWLAATPGTTPMTYGYAVTGGGTVDGTGEGIPVIATVTGTGTTTVTLEKYEGDPTGSTGFGSSFEAGYVDVYVPDVTSVSEIEIRVYYSTTVANETTLRLFWWNGTSWVECSDQGVNTVDVTIGTTEYGGYLWAKVTATSVPTLNQLNGTVFGGGSGLPASALWYEDFEYADQAAMNAVWTCGGSLWHLATETTVPSAAYSKLTPFPSSTHAAWFADPKTGKYGSGSAKAGSTTPEKRAARAHVQAKVVGYPYGVLTSPDISVSGLSAVNVSFKFFREVECYPQGQYDQTYTQVSFDGGSTWQTIWSKNSKDCTGMKSWQETGEIPVAVPSGATTMNLRFVFDALDNVGNDYLGWLIDDLTVSSSGAVGLRFAEESLDEGVVGNVYGSTVTVLGGYPEYVWRVLSGSVPGLTVTPGEATCAISGTPTQAGTYTLCLGVSDDRGQTYEKCYTIVIESQTSEPTAFWFDDFETDKGWTLSNGTSLWHRSATSCVSPAYASPTHVYYYGKDATCSYATGSKRNYGTLTSPVIPLTNVPAGTPLTIGWKYWRQVESYAGGSFDKTLVEISFDAGASWATIWTKDSADASSPGWNLVEIMQDVSGAEIVKPSAATSLLIRFFFDTTDGYANQYTGWLIDDVKAVQQSETPATLAITTQCGDLADGEVGKAYDGQLAASGGVPPYTWSSNPTPPIPGVTFDASTGALSGTPTTKGSYTPTFTVTDSVGSKAQLGPCTIDVAEASPCPTDLLLEGFEDLTGWGAQGLWHLTSGAQCVTCGLLAGNYPYFGVDNTCSYSTGARVQGALSSPAFPVDACVTGVRIAFDSFRHVEDFFGGSYDRTWVEVSWDNATWVQVWFKDSTTLSPTCENVVADLNVPAGATQMWIRFRFDSIDKFFNGFPGWAIDNLTVKNGAGLPGFAPKAMTFSAPAGSPRDQAGAVTILNIPNPVRDVHTTTFCVRGEGIEAIRIQIFDLAHTLVFEEEVDGTELIWHTVNTYGEYLANGVYLYRAFVLIDGDWIATPFEKLVILR